MALERIMSDATGRDLLEVKDRLGNRPLHTCANNNSVATAKLLLSCGIDVESKNTLGENALHGRNSI